MKKDKKAEKKQNKKKKQAVDDEQQIVFTDGQEHSDEEMELFFESRKTVRNLIAPLGVNPNPLEYMVVDDNGVELYTMCFYIHALPRMSSFARTYATLFNTPDVTSTVFIDPMVDGQSSKQLDKRIVQLDSESIAAEKEQDRNRFRKINQKLQNAEEYASAVETGDNRLFNVAFLFTLQAASFDDLKRKVTDFHMRAKEKGIDVNACYGVHPEAFISGYPTNRLYVGKRGLAKSVPVKWHVFDKYALLDIFNHTRCGFSHKDGVFVGHIINTGEPVFYNVYDKSHDGFGVIFSGKTGTGKSATIKEMSSRNVDFGYKIRSIDFDARGPRGEYSIEAEMLGGVSFQIKSDSEIVLNPFEVDVTDEFNEITGAEYKVLDLASKKVNLLYLIMTMIKDGREIENFSEEKFIRRIVTDVISECYADKGIIHGQVESLYEQSKVLVNGRLGSGQVKKKLPTLTDFYKRVLIKARENTNAFYERPYRLILDSMKDSVRELYYCKDCMKFYTREEFEEIKKEHGGFCQNCETGELEEIHGTRAYFDGQSTVHVSNETPHINFDISQLPKEERPVAMLICMDFMQESYIKKNSADPKKAKKMIMLIDEVHRSFVYPEARQFISDAYRTYRKRHVSPWVATQALADFDGYKETKAIVKNATTMFLFKQDFQDRKFLAESTPLTSSQLEELFMLGGDLDDENDQENRRGEVCIIDNQSKVAFVKVDYLTASESVIVETNIKKIQEMYKGNTDVNIA